MTYQESLFFARWRCPRARAQTLTLWQNAAVFQRLTERKEWKFFGVLPKADPRLAAAWWIVLLLRGILPAAFVIAMGLLVGAVQRGDPLTGPLAFAGAMFDLQARRFSVPGEEEDRTYANDRAVASGAVIDVATVQVGVPP